MKSCQPGSLVPGILCTPDIACNYSLIFLWRFTNYYRFWRQSGCGGQGKDFSQWRGETSRSFAGGFERIAGGIDEAGGWVVGGGQM